MRYKFYREHKYVSYAVNNVERLIAKTDFTIRSEIELVNREFAVLVQMLKGHAQYEDMSLHELLRKKNSKVWDHIQEDHQHFDHEIERLQSLLAEINESTEKEQLIELGYQFYLKFRKFAGENLIHLHEEETIILPELQRLYSDDELKQVEFNTYKIMTSDELIEMLQVLFPHMNKQDKIAFLSDIKESQPVKYQEIMPKIQALLN